jgi:hypothetical protein
LDDAHIADDNMRHWNIENGDEKHESINIDTLKLSVGQHRLKVIADLGEDKVRNDNSLEMYFEVISSILQGDLNNDGKVNLSDLSILSSNYGATNCGNIADFNGDCVVNVFDYNIFKGEMKKYQ